MKYSWMRMETKQNSFPKETTFREAGLTQNAEQDSVKTFIFFPLAALGNTEVQIKSLHLGSDYEDFTTIF